MRPSPTLLWSGTLALSTAALWIGGSRAATARGEATRAHRQLEAAVSQAQELARLRATAAAFVPATDGETDGAGLTERVSKMLAVAGLPASAMASLAPGAETPVTGPDGQAHAHRRHATLVLSSLTLPQVGAFLAAWRGAEPGWVVASLELAPLGGAGGRPPAGGDLPLRAVVGLEAVVTAQGGRR